MWLLQILRSCQRYYASLRSCRSFIRTWTKFPITQRTRPRKVSLIRYQPTSYISREELARLLFPLCESIYPTWQCLNSRKSFLHRRRTTNYFIYEYPLSDSLSKSCSSFEFVTNAKRFFASFANVPLVLINFKIALQLQQLMKKVVCDCTSIKIARDIVRFFLLVISYM